MCVAMAAMLMFGGCVADDNPSTPKDGDGQTIDGDYAYTGRTVKIGSLTWMAENLNRVTDNSWCYDNIASNCVRYGRLYTWDAAMSACPAGWRLPDREDWDDLLAAVDNPTCTKLKSRAPDWNGTDDFGFSALPGGYRYADGSFDYFGTGSGWWSTAEWQANVDDARYLYMSSSCANTAWYNDNKNSGFSVRCVQ